MLFGDRPKGNKFANASIGENNIDLPLYLRDDLVKTIKVSQLGYVSLNSINVGADCLHGLIEFFLAAARYEDVGTLFDEKFCSRQSNPFCSAGDDGGLAFELFGHCLSPLLLNWNLLAPMVHARSLTTLGLRLSALGLRRDPHGSVKQIHHEKLEDGDKERPSAFPQIMLKQTDSGIQQLHGAGERTQKHQRRRRLLVDRPQSEQSQRNCARRRVHRQY